MTPLNKTIARIVGLILITFTTTAIAKKEETRELMGKLLGQFASLKVYMSSSEKFLDPKNASEISGHLKELVKLAKKSKHDRTLMQENFKFSRFVLEDHIVDTERVFRLGNKAYARWKLNATVHVCMSCHTQMPSKSRTMGSFMETKNFTSEFEQAEFLFATRAFDRAVEIYGKIIEGYPGNGYGEMELETSLERLVAYYSRVKRTPTEALVQFRVYQQKKDLPEYLQRNITAWLSQLEKWNAQQVFDPKTATEQQVLEFAKKNIEAPWGNKMLEASNPNLVNYLRASGVLFEYLQTHPQAKNIPDVLYWLAMSDRAVENTFFYSLSDLYLRECITKYPSQPIAKKCYRDYEQETIFGYTGSSGEHVPYEVRQDLKRLKKLVDTGGKVEIRNR